MAYAMGSAPSVSPPTASASQPALAIASRPSWPISCWPSGDIVVSRASMYNEDCRPDANVKFPRFAERVASNRTSWSWSVIWERDVRDVPSYRQSRPRTHHAVFQDNALRRAIRAAARDRGAVADWQSRGG